MTQPAVSSRIRQIEEYYGVRLFVRRHNGISLTGAGRDIYNDAERIVELCGDMDNKLRCRTEPKSTCIKLGATPAAADFLLRDPLQAFHTKHPGIRIHIEVHDQIDITVALQEHDIELAATETDIAMEHLSVEYRWQNRIMVVALRDHPLIKRSHVTPKRLMHYPVICPGTRKNLYQMLLAWATEKNAGVTPHINTDFTGMSTVLDAVRAGMGIAVVPEMNLHDKKLAKRGFNPPLTETFHLTRLVRHRPGEAVGAMLDYLHRNGRSQEDGR